MIFDETLYARDDEMDEFGDSGAYGDSLEEDYEEEEEEEEAAELPAISESEPKPGSRSICAGAGRWRGRPRRHVSPRRKRQPRRNRRAK